MTDSSNIRSYIIDESIVFRKTKEEFGGLSNMAPGYNIKLGDIIIGTSEALYQACRFPNSIEVQKMIIEQKSPMTAKMKSKPFRSETRSDWLSVRVSIMRWCLRAKLACNFEKFSNLLISTNNKPIVEDSRRDSFWGAIQKDDGNLVGENVLGRLLMELRELLTKNKNIDFKSVAPLPINDFKLLGNPIPHISIGDEEKNIEPDEKKKFIQLELFKDI